MSNHGFLFRRNLKVTIMDPVVQLEIENTYRSNTGEDWAEKAAAEIAYTLGINAATVELAEYGGRIGCISCNFIDVDAGEALVHGNEIMAWKVTGYDKAKIFRQADHTLENI